MGMWPSGRWDCGPAGLVLGAVTKSLAALKALFVALNCEFCTIGILSTFSYV